MSLGIFYKGEDLDLEFDLTDDSEAAIVWAELDELVITLKVNQKPVIALSKTGESIIEGSAAGKVLIGVGKQVTAKWPTGTLSAELVLTLDGSVVIAKTELYKVVKTESSTGLL